MTVHVVCRNCTYERLEETETKAEHKAQIHERLTAHDVDYGRVDGERSTPWGEQLTVEFTDRDGERRRVTFESHGGGEHLRRVEVRQGCSWRPVGVEIVSGVVVTRERAVGKIVVDDGP